MNISKTFKALGNSHRLAIFEYLCNQEGIAVDAPADAPNHVGAIAQQFDLALSTISHHLRVLHEAGLIECKQQGQYIYCAINWDTVAQMRHFLNPKENTDDSEEEISNE